MKQANIDYAPGILHYQIFKSRIKTFQLRSTISGAGFSAWVWQGNALSANGNIIEKIRIYVFWFWFICFYTSIFDLFIMSNFSNSTVAKNLIRKMDRISTIELTSSWMVSKILYFSVNNRTDLFALCKLYIASILCIFIIQLTMVINIAGNI